MKIVTAIAFAAVLGGFGGLTPLASAVTVGQVDTFEDGTTANWIVNLLGMGVHPAPPVNEPTGGPAGVDDNFLRLTSVGGAGAGSRLSVINLEQWSGNYIADGVGAISMDLRNFGDTALSIRLLLADPMGAPPQNEAISSAVVLPAGSGWTRVTIPVRPSTLVAQTGNVVSALTNATELRIFHNPDAGFPGPAVVASLGVDNITADAVIPEPATTLLAAAGLILFWNKRRATAR